ncbi:hypothetical protein QL285_058633 [Trifolium repens]|nr:hypothetical protein QL285_058633 [Trifolium repens]
MDEEYHLAPICKDTFFHHSVVRLLPNFILQCLSIEVVVFYLKILDFRGDELLRKLEVLKLTSVCGQV